MGGSGRGGDGDHVRGTCSMRQSHNRKPEARKRRLCELAKTFTSWSPFLELKFAMALRTGSGKKSCCISQGCVSVCVGSLTCVMSNNPS